MTIPKILIADDDERILKLLNQAFKDQEWEIFLAKDGDEGLESVLENRPDVALLDLRMPHAEGISVLGDMRRRGLDTDVLILTGYGTVDSAVEAMKQGARDFIAKPFHIREVVEKIQGLLQSRYGSFESLIDQMDFFVKEKAEDAKFRLSDLCERFRISERYASKLFRENLAPHSEDGWPTIVWGRPNSSWSRQTCRCIGWPSNAGSAAIGS